LRDGLTKVFGRIDLQNLTIATHIPQSVIEGENARSHNQLEDPFITSVYRQVVVLQALLA